MAFRPFQFVAPRAAKFAEDLRAAIVQVVVPRHVLSTWRFNFCKAPCEFVWMNPMNTKNLIWVPEFASEWSLYVWHSSPPLPARKIWGERCCHRAIVGSGRSCSSDVGPPCAMFDDSLLHPPATVVATTATTTSTSTTTTTLTTTTETVTTTTETVTTTTVTETSSTSSTQTLTWTTTTTTTLLTWTTTTVLTSSWTPWLEATVGTANKTNSSEFPGWNLKIWSCFWWFLVHYTDVQKKDEQTNLGSQRLESMDTSKRWSDSDRTQAVNCWSCKSDWKFAASAIWKFAASAIWVAYIHMHGLNPDAWFSQTFKRWNSMGSVGLMDLVVIKPGRNSELLFVKKKSFLFFLTRSLYIQYI